MIISVECSHYSFANPSFSRLDRNTFGHRCGRIFIGRLAHTNRLLCVGTGSLRFDDEAIDSSLHLAKLNREDFRYYVLRD